MYCDIAVVGGGLGGIAACCGLRMRGFDAHIFEAAPALRTSTGTLIGLGDNAFTALDWLHPDIGPGIKAQGAHTKQTRSVICPGRGQECTVQTRPAGIGLVTVRWSAVQNVLAALVPPEAVHCGHKATGYTEISEEEGGGVRVHFKGKPDVTARLVIAADGLRSALRATMIPNDPGPRYLGHMNWNAVLHNPGGTVIKAHEPDELRIYMDVMDRAKFKISIYVIDAGSGYTFWQVRTQSDEPSFTNSNNGDSSPEPTDNGTANGHHDTAANGNGDSSNADGAATAAAGGANDDYKQVVGGGLGVPGSKARVLRMLRDAGFDDVADLVELTEEGAIFERAMLDRVPLDELGVGVSSPGHRVVLLGDAMHAMHSGPGQGGRSAFEDAHQLVQALEQHRDQLGWANGSAAAAGGNDSSSNTGKQLIKEGNALSQEQAALAAVVKQYQDVRLPRVCRIQRYAAEGCGLPALQKAAAAHAGVVIPKDPEGSRTRFMEFNKWVGQYPHNVTGDPDSVYWKPLPASELQQQACSS